MFIRGAQNLQIICIRPISHLSLLSLCGKQNCMFCNVTGNRKQAANHVPLVAP